MFKMNKLRFLSRSTA